MNIPRREDPTTFLVIFPALFLFFLLLFFAAPASASALSVTKSIYGIGETVNVSCGNSGHAFVVYDLTNDGHMGEYSCASPSLESFAGVDGHSYTILELSSGASCASEAYDACSPRSSVVAEMGFTVSAAGGSGGSVSSPSLQSYKSVYTPSETVHVTCSYSRHIFIIYDITPGIDGNISIGGNIGQYSCGSPASVAFDSVDGHSYTILELYNTETCVNESYDACSPRSSVVAEMGFTVSAVGGGGSGVSASLRTNKSIYNPTDAVQVTCPRTQDSFVIYDITAGIDGNIGSGGNIGLYQCGSPTSVTFGGLDMHSYVVLQLTGGTSCASESYDACASQSFVRGVVYFSVSQTVVPERRGATTYDPEVTIFAPTEGSIFSREGIIQYTATDKNDLGNEEERTIFGLGLNPVSIYYSDKIAEWDHTLIPAEDKVLVEKGLPAKGPYKWHIKDLVPGIFYRVIVDAVDKLNMLGEEVSDIFTVDFDAPVFTVSVDPPVTRKDDVTITVEASKDLAKIPVVKVTQKGGKPIEVKMTGTGSRYEGVYSIKEGHDGIAAISVEGVDRAGNKGSTIVTGGSFAVGIDPPPKPSILSPREGDVLATSTISVSGTTREDTTIVLKVNGVDTYHATSSAEGTFVIRDVRLNKEANRGVNTLSVAAIDQAGTKSSEVSVKLKFNIPPVIALVSPKESGVISAQTALEVSASDENKEPLLFTYQIIAAEEYDAALEVITLPVSASASSTPVRQNAWVTVADGVPSSKFVWESSEVEDGEYFLRVIADDGTVKVSAAPTGIRIHNTSPVFRFEDGRKTIIGTTTAVVVGRVFTPLDISPRPIITKAEYSLDNGKQWTAVRFTSGSSTPEARFAVAFTGLKEGTKGVLWRVRDSRNFVGRATHSIIVDMTPPQAPRILSPKLHAVVSDESDTDKVRTGLQIDISGTAESGSTVILSFASSTLNSKVGANGGFVFRGVGVEQRGVNAISIQARDAGGNTSVANLSDITYDNPPTVSILEPKQFRALKGRATVTWRIGDADNDPIQNVTLSYRRAGGAWKALPIDTKANSYEWDLTGFPEAGDYQLQLEASDGLVAARDTTNFSIDTTPPGTPSFTLRKSVIGASETLEVYGAATDGLSGIEFVEYAISDPRASDEEKEWFTGLVTEGFLQKRASFSIKHSARVADGSYELSVRAVDAAGNVSPSLRKAFIVDATPPRVGSFAVVKDSVRIPPSQEGVLAVYPDSPVSFSLSLEGDTVAASLAVDNKITPLVKNIASGLWEADMSVGTGTPILLSAEDAVHNKVSAKRIGSFAVVGRGSIKVRLDGGTSKPVSGAGIKVLVLDESGTFVPFATSLSRGKAEAVADEKGEYELALGTGTYRLVAHAKGYQTQVHTLTLQTPALVNIAFETEEISSVRAFLQSVTDYFNYSL